MGFWLSIRAGCSSLLECAAKLQWGFVEMMKNFGNMNLKRPFIEEQYDAKCGQSMLGK